jgi:hypothetical protein
MCHRADGQRAHAGGRFATWIRSTRVKFAVVGSSRAIPEEQLSIAAKTSNGAEMQMQHVYVAFVHVSNGKPGMLGGKRIVGDFWSSLDIGIATLCRLLDLPTSREVFRC